MTKSRFTPVIDLRSQPRQRTAKRLVIFLTIVTWLILLLGCRSEHPTWDRIEKTQTLRVGLDPTYPPFEIVDATGLHGLDVDLIRAVAANYGLEVEFVYFGYDGLYDALGTEQVDVLASALVIAPERARDFAYTDPYFNAGEIVMVPAAERDIEKMSDLAGHILAVELGALGHVEANSWANRLPTLQVRPYNSAEEAMTAVVQGQADAVLVDAINGRLFLKQDPRLKRLPQPVTVEPFALVVRAEDDLLLDKLNAGLKNLEETGELDDIIKQWLE